MKRLIRFLRSEGMWKTLNRSMEIARRNLFMNKTILYFADAQDLAEPSPKHDVELVFESIEGVTMRSLENVRIELIEKDQD